MENIMKNTQKLIIKVQQNCQKTDWTEEDAAQIRINMNSQEPCKRGST